jgi:hypothetical protein
MPRHNVKSVNTEKVFRSLGKPVRSTYKKLLKGLILAQNERWRRGLGMQVERIPAMGEAA